MFSRSPPNPIPYESRWRRFLKDEKGKGREAKTKLGAVFLFKEWTEEINVKGKKDIKYLKALVFKCF